MLCIKLGAVIRSRDMLESVVANHKFEDGNVENGIYYLARAHGIMYKNGQFFTGVDWCQSMRMHQYGK